MYISSISLIVLFIYLKSKNYHITKERNKKILGFQINGIGNGHITQAKTIYDILVKHYEIPVVVIYTRNQGCDKLFENSQVIYQDTKSDVNSTNEMSIYSSLVDIFRIKKTRYFEKKYLITNWINFFVTDLFNFRTKQINIASQFNQNDIRIYLCIIMCYLFSYTTVFSIFKNSRLSKYKIPALIDLKKIKRDSVKSKLILSYSVSGYDFPNELIKLAVKYPDFNFKYFTNKKVDLNFPKNIECFKSDKKIFKEYLQKCEAVLCTSGNELIQECVFNNIPVATMPCSKKQFEQNNNFKLYLNFKYAKSMKDIDLNKLVKQKNEFAFKNFNRSLENREEKILKLFQKLL